MATSHQEKKDQRLGRLTSLGVQSPWQCALLFPNHWQDLRHFSDRLPDSIPDGSVCLVLKVISSPKFNRTQSGVPRTTFRIEDRDGWQGMATVWGDARKITGSLQSGFRAAFWGKLSQWNGMPQLTVEERIAPRWLNHLRPVYPGKSGVIAPDTVRQRILDLLPEAIPEAAQVLRSRLAALGNEQALLARIGQDTPLISLLWQAHLPDSPEQGRAAHQALEHLAALDMLLQAQDNAAPQKHREPLRLSLASRSARTNALPFPLTDEQNQALEEIAEDLRRPRPMRRLLTGDVGTGKTAVYASAAAMAVDAGARVAILLPNIPLATQVHREIQQWWPDLAPRLVEAGGGAEASQEAVVVGTTALLHAQIGPRDLVIVDEQQKFSREQRERLLAQDSHLLEVSATCIPRSQALISFGVHEVSRLTQGHVDKQIQTRVQTPESRRAVFDACRESVQMGHQLAIIYPLREGDDQGEQDHTRKAAEQAHLLWGRHFPGRVRLLHGQMGNPEKQAVIEDLRQDRADVLISTTVVEVGLTLPRLRHMLVVDAERYGLTTLHQLRGRLARHGGEGRMDLYLSREVPEATLERLRCMEQTTDGFELAEMDLKLRGYGDLAGAQQHGAVSSLLVGRTVNVEHMAQVAHTLSETIASDCPEPVDWTDSMEHMQPPAPWGPAEPEEAEDDTDDLLADLPAMPQYPPRAALGGGKTGKRHPRPSPAHASVQPGQTPDLFAGMGF